MKVLEARQGSAGSNKNLKIVQRGRSDEDWLKEIEAECKAVKDWIGNIEDDIQNVLAKEDSD